MSARLLGQYRLNPDETEPRGGRPPNPLISRLMAKEGISRATAFRRLKAKREAQLAKLARLGNGRDHLNQHRDGWHPTPPRGVFALLTVESFAGVLWEPACGDGAISRILEAAGHQVLSTDLVFRGYGRGDHDFLTDHVTLVDHVVTNPPYSAPVGLAAQFVEHALTRIRPGGTVCMLLPTKWEAAQRHRLLMQRCRSKYTFSRRLAMHRGGYNGKKNNPQLDCSWYVFSNEHAGPTLTSILARTQHSCHQVQSDGRVRSLMRRGGSVRTPSNSKGLWCIRRSEFNWDRLRPVDYGAPDCPALCLPGIILPVAD